MSGAARLVTLGVVAGAAAWGGLAAGERGFTVSSLQDAAVMQVSMLLGRDVAAMPAPEPTGAVIYWRHPDGLPEWSGTEAVTADGRAFLPVRSSEDISLDPSDKPVAAPAPEEGAAVAPDAENLDDTGDTPAEG